MGNLGPIGVSFAYADTRDELLNGLRGFMESMPPEQADLDRIVLIIPNSLRERLGWPKDCAPQPTVFAHDLVFAPPV